MQFKKMRNHIPTKSSSSSFHTEALVSCALQSPTAAEAIAQHKQMLEILVLLYKLGFSGFNSTVYAMSIIVQSDNLNTPRELSPYKRAEHFFPLGKIYRSHGVKSVVGQIIFPLAK